MIHAILNLCNDIHDRTNALLGVFKRCCKDGCLNQHILNTLIEENTKELNGAERDAAHFLFGMFHRKERAQVLELQLHLSRTVPQ